MFSEIKQALLTAVRVQHLALLLAVGATVEPLQPPSGHPGWRLGRVDQAYLPQALQHPLVQLALRIREWRLRRLLARMASRTST